ncbi:MAG: hypothetical protein H7Y31_10295 [Chitinophagaceae bacterium]|nr:hypothetical protein [Chitinophagaceae bacterium]
MKLTLRVSAICVLLTCLSSWGFLVHRTINQLSVYQLPKSMQPFFFSNMDYIVKNSVRADQRRNTDSTEAVKHFIDFEYFGDSSAWKMPTDWEGAIKMYSRDSVIAWGYVPFHVVRMKDDLTRAFKNQNADSILFYAADLAHYIGDAHVPLHTTANYDGQLTNQKGLHALWESVVPEIDLPAFNLSTSHRASYISDPSAAIWRAARAGFVLVDAVLAHEKQATAMFTDSTKYRMQLRNGREVRYYTTAFAKEYQKRLGKMVNDRLLASSEMIADFWFTCWQDAGKPNLSGLLKTPLTDEQKKKCKLENKAFRKNELLKNNWLISRKDAKPGGDQ